MFLDTVVFPPTIALGSTGGPRFLTAVVESTGGHERRSQQWPQSLGRWEVSNLNRTDAEAKELLALFYVACGRAHAFRLHDFTAGEAAGTAEYLGTGDGVKTDFFLRKFYQAGSNIYVRRILKPITASVVVTVDGVVSTDYTQDGTVGMIQFTAPVPLGKIVRASFTFDIPVRFDIDALSPVWVEPGLTSFPSITLVEVSVTMAHEMNEGLPDPPARFVPSDYGFTEGWEVVE
jgi:uncharacterized protein (TIGR02217 family)